MKEKIIKIIPDFFEYYIPTDIEEYDSIDDFIVSRLEHEVYLYTNYENEGFTKQQEVSYVNKNNIRKVNELLKKYYNNEIYNYKKENNLRLDKNGE